MNITFQNFFLSQKSLEIFKFLLNMQVILCIWKHVIDMGVINLTAIIEWCSY